MANILKGIDKIITSDGNTTVDLANIQATGGAGSVSNTELGIAMSETSSAIYYDLNVDAILPHGADGHTSDVSENMITGGGTTSVAHLNETKKISFTDANITGWTQLNHTTSRHSTVGSGTEAMKIAGWNGSNVTSIDKISFASSSDYTGGWASGTHNSGASATDGDKVFVMDGDRTGSLETLSFTTNSNLAASGSGMLYSSYYNKATSDGSHAMAAGGTNTDAAGYAFLNLIAFADNSVSVGTNNLLQKRHNHLMTANGGTAMIMGGAFDGWGASTDHCEIRSFDTAATSELAGTLAGPKTSFGGSSNGQWTMAVGGYLSGTLTQQISKKTFDTVAEDTSFGTLVAASSATYSASGKA